MNRIILSAVTAKCHNNRTLFSKLNRKWLKTKKNLLMKKMRKMMKIYQVILSLTTLHKRRSRRIWECKVCGVLVRSKLHHLNNSISKLLSKLLKWRSRVRRLRSTLKMSQLMNWMKKKTFTSLLSLTLTTNLETSMNIPSSRHISLFKLQLTHQPILHCYQIHQTSSWTTWELNQTTSWTPKTHFWQMMWMIQCQIIKILWSEADLTVLEATKFINRKMN